MPQIVDDMPAGGPYLKLISCLKMILDGMRSVNAGSENRGRRVQGGGFE